MAERWRAYGGVGALSRREFLGVGVAGLGALAAARRLAGAPAAWAQTRPLGSRFVLAQVQYRGGDWDPHPGFAEPIIEEMLLRTSIDCEPHRTVVTLTDPRLFTYPFLYITGRYEFDPLTPGEREALARYIRFGGFLFAEDCIGWSGHGFDKAFRALMADLIPEGRMHRLSSDHSVYRSFYLLKALGGRRIVSNHLEGITLDDWTPVLYCMNDLGCAWDRDPRGTWRYPCVPGGEPQRADAFKTGVNIIVYALTENYKRDLIHHPFIKERLEGRGG